MIRVHTSKRMGRLAGLVDLLAAGASSAEELARHLGCARRTVDQDLAALRAACGDRLVGITGSDHRKRFHWQGPRPLPVADPPHWLDEDEFLALVIARGLMRDPGGSDERSLFGHALGLLIDRLGLGEEAEHLDPDLIQVRRFAGTTIDPELMRTVVRALTRDDVLRFTYTNLRHETKRVLAIPLRLICIREEWYLLAWTADVPDGRHQRRYHLGRMSAVRCSEVRPLTAPAHVPRAAIEDALAESFAATGSDDLSARRRVVLAVAPAARPHLVDRTWGGNQHWDPQPPDLPTGWARLAFTTTGLDQCRHWVLSFGETLRVEQPAELIDWLHRQARAILADKDPV